MGLREREACWAGLRETTAQHTHIYIFLCGHFHRFVNHIEDFCTAFYDDEVRDGYVLDYNLMFHVNAVGNLLGADIGTHLQVPLDYFQLLGSGRASVDKIDALACGVGVLAETQVEFFSVFVGLQQYALATLNVAFALAFFGLVFLGVVGAVFARCGIVALESDIPVCGHFNHVPLLALLVIETHTACAGVLFSAFGELGFALGNHHRAQRIGAYGTDKVNDC